MEIFLLSKRNAIASPSYAHIYALENIFRDTCGARVIAPVASESSKRIQNSNLPKRLEEKVLNPLLFKSNRLYKSINRVEGLSANETNVLLLIGMHGGDLGLLSCLKDWRKKFDLVIAFIQDAWIFEAFPDYTTQLDCLFVAIKDLIEPLRAQFSIPVAYLPYSEDVLERGSCNVQRSIDVTSYGRIPSEYHNRLFDLSDRGPSHPGGRNFFYYRQVPEGAQLNPDEPFTPSRFDYQHSALISNVLANSKLSLAFDFTYTVQRAVELPNGHNHPSYQYRKPVLGWRWYEGIAAGAALVGKRPPIPEADELLDWEDATIELPDDPDAGVEAILELLQDEDRLHAIHHRNYWNALNRHDHRHRMETIFTELALPIPPGLQEQLDRMAYLCSCSGILSPV